MSLSGPSARKSACKFGIGMVFVLCEFEYDASIRLNARSVDRNFRPDRRKDVRAPVFCLADSGICVVSLAPISTVMCSVGTPVTKFRVPCWSTDCIRLIEHCTMSIAAHCDEIATIGLAVAAAAAAHCVEIAMIGLVAAPEVATDCRWNNSSMKIALVSVSNRPTMRTTVPARSAIAANCIQPASLATGILASIHLIDCVHIGSFLASGACRATSMWVCNCRSWWAVSI